MHDRLELDLASIPRPTRGTTSSTVWLCQRQSSTRWLKSGPGPSTGDPSMSCRPCRSIRYDRRSRSIRGHGHESGGTTWPTALAASVAKKAWAGYPRTKPKSVEQHLIPVPPDRSLAQLADTVRRAQDYAARPMSPRTKRAYAADWRHFSAWTAAREIEARPATPDTVALYFADLAEQGAKASTIARRLVVISQAHKEQDLPSPTTSNVVRRVHSGIRRTHGTAQEGKAPTLVADIKTMVDKLPRSRVGHRDRALLLLGFAGAFRRSELVSLDVGDLEFVRAGMIVSLRRGKTDQEGAGRRIGIPFGSSRATCPVRAVQQWLAATRITDGPIFRAVDRFDRVQPGRLCDRSVALVVKRWAEKADMDPTRYAGHSLRAGLATSAAAANVEERKIAQQTGQTSLVILRRYIREADLFKGNAAGAVGL
jgi:site-specific recombinase XerD